MSQPIYLLRVSLRNAGHPRDAIIDTAHFLGKKIDQTMDGDLPAPPAGGITASQITY